MKSLIEFFRDYIEEDGGFSEVEYKGLNEDDIMEFEGNQGGEYREFLVEHVGNSRHNGKTYRDYTITVTNGVGKITDNTNVGLSETIFLN